MTHRNPTTVINNCIDVFLFNFLSYCDVNIVLLFSVFMLMFYLQRSCFIVIPKYGIYVADLCCTFVVVVFCGLNGINGFDMLGMIEFGFQNYSLLFCIFCFVII